MNDLVVLCASLLLVGAIVWFRQLKQRQKAKVNDTPLSSPTSDKGLFAPPPTDRSFGEWEAVKFEFPKFEPIVTPLEEIKPPPYRPFRWGKYNITMGIRNMQWEDWIEVDNQLPHYHAIRTKRFNERGRKLVDVLPPRPGIPGGALAAKELAYELSEYLSRRYPDVYKVTRHPPQPGDFGWYGEGQVKEITMVPVNTTYNLDEQDPMMISGMLIEDDLALMLEGSDGRYYFQAGAILVPGFWRMEDKIGLPLEEIHTRGDVPRYEEKLKNSMARFFIKMTVDKPVLRNNYFVQIVRSADDPERQGSIDPDELAWSDTTNGNEDHFDQATKEPTLEAQQSGLVEFLPPKPTKSEEDIRFRTERQSLRRLPRSGAIVFTIRTYVAAIVDLAKEPGVPGRMASAIRSWPEDVAFYKGQKLYKDAILPYLDRCHDEQVAQGIVAEDDHSSNYPY